MSTKNSNRVCMVAGCERRHMARGLCKGHYGRWCAAGRPFPVEAFARQQDLIGVRGRPRHLNGVSTTAESVLRDREQAIANGRTLIEQFDELARTDRQLACEIAAAILVGLGGGSGEAVAV